VPAADVVVGLVAELEAAEEQRRGRVVGQLGDPAGQGAAEALRAVGVAGHVFADGIERLGALAHPPQGSARSGQVVAFVVEIGV
jgi:hypothetical protein